MSASPSNKRKVAVAMSGGVDSSVATAILAEEGYEVFGVTMQLKPSENAMEAKTAKTCSSSAAVEDARQVAAHIGIPHYVVNLKDIFQEMIIENFIEEYRRGRTPNPCVRCNKLVKFGALLEKAKELGADYIATGHYSRIAFDKSENRWLLKRGFDHSKDQSYALHRLSQYQLAHTLMPLGNMAKDETRKMATKLGIPVAAKPESQEICFVENRDYPGYLRSVAPEIAQPGEILDTDGNLLGEHKGIAFYTIGQRRRLGISAREPRYVVDIEAKRNVIVVGKEEQLYSPGLLSDDFNSISKAKIKERFACTAKVRYNMKDKACWLEPLEDNRIRVIFDIPQRAITPGQAVVCYNGENVIGGGTIEKVLR